MIFLNKTITHTTKKYWFKFSGIFSQVCCLPAACLSGLRRQYSVLNCKVDHPHWSPRALCLATVISTVTEHSVEVPLALVSPLNIKL